MRVDKFLKVSRIVKRRSIANEMCNKKRIFINDRPVKAGYVVKVGDVLEVQYGEDKKIHLCEVLEPADHDRGIRKKLMKQKKGKYL